MLYSLNTPTQFGIYSRPKPAPNEVTIIVDFSSFTGQQNVHRDLLNISPNLDHQPLVNRGKYTIPEADVEKFTAKLNQIGSGLAYSRIPDTKKKRRPWQKYHDRFNMGHKPNQTT